MQQHVLNYLNHFHLTTADYIKCELDCDNVAVDIHHVIPRSKFGSKRKDEQDHVSNLIALCRLHHEKAHEGKLKVEIENVIKKRNK